MEAKYALVDVGEMPDLGEFKSQIPRILSNGMAVLKWVSEECPVDAVEANFEKNRFQTDMRRWYTHDEILRVIDLIDPPRFPNG